MPATLLKKRLWHRCFPVEFAKFLRTTFLYRTPPVATSERRIIKTQQSKIAWDKFLCNMIE